MPTNLYGYNDNFDLKTSHVIPAMIRKFHEAKLNNDKSVVLWGTGKPMREFLFAEDLADAVIFSMENKLTENMYNIGTGNDISIRDLATIIKKIIGYQGDIIWDNSKPDGTPKKLMDISKMESLGWKYSTNIEEGIKKTYDWFLDNIGKIKEIKL
jgi:GDP-L-fucose synthase